MKLRTQTLLTFLVALVCALTAETALVVGWVGVRLDANRQSTSEGLHKIHSQYSDQYLLRLAYAIESEGKSLTTQTRSYAFWDVLWDFGRHPTRAVAEDNFSDGALKMVDLDFVLVFDAQGRVLVGRTFPPGSRDASRTLTPAEASVWGPGTSLWSLGTEAGIRGVLEFEGTGLLAASLPLLDSQGAGPPSGVLVFGRFLRATWQAELGRAVQIPFRILDFGDSSIPAEARPALALGGDKATWLGPRAIYGNVPGELGTRRLVLEAEVPPDLLNEERTLLENQEADYRALAGLFLLGLLLCGLAVAGPFLFLLNRDIIRPIRAIDVVTKAIVDDPDHPAPIPSMGATELQEITASINSMVAALDLRRRELAEANQSLVLRDQALKASLLPVIVTDADQTIVTVNDAFTRIYGYLSAEVIGRNPRLLNPGPEGYSEVGLGLEAYQDLFTAMKEGLADPGRHYWEGMLFNRKKSGQVIPCQVVISTILGPAGVLGYVGWTIDLTKRIQAEEEVRIEVYQALSELAEKRDNETGQHIRRLGISSAELARLMRLSPHFVKEIEVFAPLHDIGKVGIQDAILLAPYRLDDQEFEVMRTHAFIGYSILAGRKTMEVAAEIAFAHHERWDGTGYPRGLSAEQIPLAARIVSVVDVYDALRSHRPYKEAWTHTQAVDYLASTAGTHFDPDIVSIFLLYADRFDRLFEEHRG